MHTSITSVTPNRHRSFGRMFQYCLPNMGELNYNVLYVAVAFGKKRLAYTHNP
jgi:hypothetical protein